MAAGLASPREVGKDKERGCCEDPLLEGESVVEQSYCGGDH